MGNEIMERDDGNVKAELDIQITTAKAYPRDMMRCLEEAKVFATANEEIAESCIYSLPRGKDKQGKQQIITGPSVRLAEIMMSCWGNIRAATRIVSNDGKIITAEGAAWDLEKNVRIAMQVQRSISGKFGTFSADMQVVTGNAASAIALRNAIYKVIPKSLVDIVYDAATKAAIGDQKRLSEKIRKCFDRFKHHGIEEEKILTYFGKSNAADLSLDDVTEMIGIGTAIKDGTMTIEKAFVEDNESANNAKTASLEAKLNAPKELKKIDPAKYGSLQSVSDFQKGLGDADAV
ncbi:MAG TPA: hypothetical protein VHZ76_00805 [Gammaproteobacteria bacterium]|nr:hypothetical protein [Gammaproteobacteria bacterium]